MSAEATTDADALELIFGASSRDGADHLVPPLESPVIAERQDLSVPGVFEVLCQPVDLEDGQGTIYIMRDVTDRELAEMEREALIRQMEDKNAELERYTYTVSHDLKSPLVTIKGFLGMIEKDALAGNMERLSSDIARVGAAADRMVQLLDELLELSRIGRMANAPEDVSLGSLAREAAALIGSMLENRRVDLNIADDLPVVRGDRLRLLEVFQNLLENAAKFMGDQSEPRIEIGAEVAGGETVCWVRDNGIGIEAAYHETVFGLFQQLDPSRGGTGIGLALVRRILEVHGGRVWVDSEGPGRGTCVSFTIPDSA